MELDPRATRVGRARDLGGESWGRHEQHARLDGRDLADYGFAAPGQRVGFTEAAAVSP